MVRKTRIEGLGRWLETQVSDLSAEDAQIDTPYAPILWEQDEVKTVALKLTYSEFVKVCAALQNGSYLTYPDNPQAVYWSFLRNYEYPIPMVDCEDILDCIEDTPEIREEIAGISIGGSAAFEAALKRNSLGKFDDSVSYEDAQGDCLPDNLFGAVSQLLTVLHENNLDFLELVEVTSNRLEFATIISNITGIDEATIFDVVFGFLDYIVANFEENYIAAYTDELYDEMRCDIFCLAQPDCELTLDVFWEYFAAKMASFNLSTIDIMQIMETFTTGEFLSEYTVFAFMWLQLAFLKGIDTGFVAVFGREIGGSSSRLLLQLLAFSNDPDPDWSVLCDDCAPEEFIIQYNHPVSQVYTLSQISSREWRLEYTAQPNNTGGYVTDPSNASGAGGGAVLPELYMEDGSPFPTVFEMCCPLEYPASPFTRTGMLYIAFASSFGQGAVKILTPVGTLLTIIDNPL